MNPFEYVKPTAESVDSIQAIRGACKDLHDVILANIPNSQERSLAITNLEQVSMWANKGIVFNQNPPDDSVEIHDEQLERAMTIAMVCHEANRAYCRSIGDFSQPTWDGAPDWQKDSAITGALARLNDPSLSSEDIHQKWVEYKAADGWGYGEVKDAEKKTHPCMVPYDQLPSDQKRKDALFNGIVEALSP